MIVHKKFCHVTNTLVICSISQDDDNIEYKSVSKMGIFFSLIFLQLVRAILNFNFLENENNDLAGEYFSYLGSHILI